MKKDEREAPGRGENHSGSHQGNHAPGHGGRADGAADGGHGAHSAHSPEIFRQKFWVNLILTLPVLLYSAHISGWLGISPPRFPGYHLLPFVISTFIFFYGGAVFLRGANEELRNRRPGMMTLISLAIIVAYSYSVAVTFGLPGEELYWELATLITVMLLGHWLEMRAIRGAAGALDEIARLLPDTALLLDGDDVREIPASRLEVGDLVLVRPGARLPADGEVVDGDSQLDESLLTGESMPVPKGTGDRVVAGAVNAEGSLRIRVTDTGEDTALAGIMRLVAEAQASHSRTERLADRAAFWLTITAVSAATVTAAVWSAITSDTPFILERVVTVLVAACPHALGLAIPLVVSLSTTIAARNGLLIRDRMAMEESRALDAVIFDKTGTLTHGRHEVVSVRALDGYSEKEIILLAAAVEGDSEHPVARAVVRAAHESKGRIPRARDFKAFPGRGVRAVVDGEIVYVGGPNLLAHLGLDLPEGDASLYVIKDGVAIGALCTADAVQSESREAVHMLAERGVEVVMLTGDSREVTEKVAKELDLTRYFAEVLPEQKASYVERLRGEGLRVDMVGDGVNDAPALAAADVGVAIGAGTDVALEAADIVLVSDDPRDVVAMIDLSRATYRKMLENLFWASGYNVVVIPLAAGILAPIGFVLPMAVGALIMSMSTIIVALNAQLLRRFEPRLGAWERRNGDDSADRG